MRYGVVAACLVALSLFDSPTAGAESASADELAIRENAGKYEAFYNQGDAKSLAALWSPQAVYDVPETGERLEGRPAIQKRFEEILAADERAQLKVAVTSVRFVTPDVAEEEGLVTFVASTGEEVVSSYSAISVRKDGVWLLDSVRETVLPPPPTAFDQLQPLAFLVGEWANQDDGSTVHSVFRWSESGAFLVQTFTVILQDDVNLRGTQIIGWDNAQQRIRSWMFDSDGGFGESLWDWDGNQWRVRARNTLPDGRLGAAINVYRPIDVDTLAWKSTARQVDGKPLPNTDEIIVRRITAAAASAEPDHKE